MWKVPCAEAVKVASYIAKYPVLEKENTALSNLLNNTNKLYKAEKDSLGAVIIKSEKRVKRAKRWGNVKPVLIGVLAGFIILK